MSSTTLKTAGLAASVSVSPLRPVSSAPALRPATASRLEGGLGLVRLFEVAVRADQVLEELEQALVVLRLGDLRMWDVGHAAPSVDVESHALPCAPVAMAVAPVSKRLALIGNVYEDGGGVDGNSEGGSDDDGAPIGRARKSTAAIFAYDSVQGTLVGDPARFKGERSVCVTMGYHPALSSLAREYIAVGTSKVGGQGVLRVLLLQVGIVATRPMPASPPRPPRVTVVPRSAGRAEVTPQP